MELSISKSVNTKAQFIKNPEDLINLIENLEIEDDAEKAKFNEMVNELKEIPDSKSELTLSHEEIRQKLAEIEVDSNESEFE